MNLCSFSSIFLSNLHGMSMIIGVNTNRSFSVLDMLSGDSVQGSSSLI